MRARNQGETFDQNAFQNIIEFTQRYQNVAQAKYAHAFPNPSATNEPGRWQNLGEALLGSIGTRTVSYPVKAYSQLVSNYSKGDAGAFNSVVHQ